MKGRKQYISPTHNFRKLRKLKVTDPHMSASDGALTEITKTPPRTSSSPLMNNGNSSSSGIPSDETPNSSAENVGPITEVNDGGFVGGITAGLGMNSNIRIFGATASSAHLTPPLIHSAPLPTSNSDPTPNISMLSTSSADGSVGDAKFCKRFGLTNEIVVRGK